MRKFASLIPAFALALLSLVADTGCTAKSRLAAHLHRAESYYQSGQYDLAEIEYKIVLRSTPQNIGAWSRLGLIYFEEGRLGDAAPILAHTRQLDPGNLEVRIKLGTIELLTGHQKEALTDASFVLDHNPADVKAPILLAEAADPSQFADIRQRLQGLSQKAETAPLAVALGTLAFRQKDFPAAQAQFEQALKLDPKFSDAYSALANVCLAFKDQTQADQAFKSAAELAPPRSGKTLQYAQFKISTGHPDAGRQLLEDLVKQVPDYLPGWLALAQLDAAGQNYADAATKLGNVLSRDPRNFDGLLFKGRLNLLQGQADQAILEFRRMAEVYPAVPAVRYQLALAYLSTNQTDQAILCLNQAVSLDPQFVDAILLLSQIQIQRGHVDFAMASLNRLLQQQPGQVTARLLLANAYRVQGDWGKTIQVLQDLEADNPKNKELHLLLGTAMVQQKRTAEARTELNLALQIDPSFFPALEQLVNLDLSEKRFAPALQRIQSASEKNPNQVEMRLLTAKVLLAEGNNDQAEASLLQTIAMAPESQTAYLMLAQIYHDSGKNVQALAKLDAAINKDPGDITALMLTAVIYNEEKDYKNAAATYEKLLQVNPRFSPALNNLAYLYSESFDNRLDRAYELAQTARDLAPYDPSMADTLGWISFKRGSYTLALSLLQESAAKLPNEPEVQYHLGMAAYMSGDEAAAWTAFQAALRSDRTFTGREECKQLLSILAIDAATADATAKAALEKRIQEKADDPAALSRLAVIYQREGNPDKAIAACESILQENPNNLVALLNLARIYATKDVAHALELAQNAYKLAPDNPEVCRLYGYVAGQSGDYKLAANLLQFSAQAQPDNADTLFEFAQAAFRVGRIGEAQTALQNALAHNLSGAQGAEAKQMLALLQVTATGSASPDTKAQILQILKAQPQYLPALAASATVDESQGDATAAAQTYEKILAAFPDFNPAARQLAQIYARDPAKTDRAYTFALQAHNAYPDDPAVAKTLGIILIQQGDFNRAVNLLTESVSEKSDAETYFYLGTAQYKLNSRAESKAALQQALSLNLSGNEATAARQMLQQLK